ncbi:MgtC/SapB family protein [Pseudoxanthomonas sp.]|uniref:MgtC/SapB family protein n=1 Tax=Pseudoxanthomonas sp. TaxID=1871049 RepID=UPI002605E785|nr:MgtC/SapB family protein [Pseudoxanthomonas sp.]WDS35097.1 MAG: MgtC/SapB family protein [Pseudoxanthomonas sp.]
MVTTWDIALRLLLAAALGGIIGANRGRLEWTAGLRTHMLVCVGASLAIIVSEYGFSDVLTSPHVVLDPSRIAAQVISGVGFLGAGTILFLQREQVIRGLTTAAGLWAVASIGLAAGSGLYAAAIMATVLLWSILALLKPIERRYLQKRSAPATGLRITLSRGSALAKLETALSDLQLPVRRMVLKRHDDCEDQVDVRCPPGIERARLLEVADALGDTDGVISVSLLGPVPR